jgi:hypothetical protein
LHGRVDNIQQLTGQLFQFDFIAHGLGESGEHRLCIMLASIKAMIDGVLHDGVTG